MISLKACPRCSGDLYEEEILGDRELVCLQCGSRWPFTQPQTARQVKAA